ncbi:MAG: DUF3108 domain-containing protein [Acidobacteria bacterium]|nr:DUF3108 domain-containing protein [Acidobacteriota bacterium]
MSFLNSFRRVIIGLMVIGAVSVGLKLYAQQSGALTPPPRPVSTKTAVNSTALPSLPSLPDGQPFPIGEHLSYNITWSSFPVSARLDMEVAERGQFYGLDSFQVTTKLETLGQVRSLFGEIDDQYTSYISTKTGIPYRSVNSIRHGQKQSEETIVFDYSSQQAIHSDQSMTAIQPGTFDLTSMIYGLRMRSLFEEGKQKHTVLYSKELIEVEAEVKTRDRITTQNGTYNTVCVRFSPQKKLSRYRALVWFTDDARKIPVLITAKLPFGEVRAELSSATVTVKPLSSVSAFRTLTDESGNTPPGLNGSARPRVLPFGVGERLNYDISWGNFSSVGRASFEVRQQGMLGNNRVFEFYGEATSTGVARSVINVNDRISTYALADSLIPLRTDLRLTEGKRQKLVSTAYDPSKRLASLSTGGDVALQPYTFDIISLFYAVRAADLKVGENYNFFFLDANNRLQAVTIKIAGIETIGGPLGNRDATRLDIYAPSPANSLLAQTWISNDSRKLPLYIAARTRFGELRFSLISDVISK